MFGGPSKKGKPRKGGPGGTLFMGRLALQQAIDTSETEWQQTTFEMEGKTTEILHLLSSLVLHSTDCPGDDSLMFKMESIASSIDQSKDILPSQTVVSILFNAFASLFSFSHPPFLLDCLTKAAKQGLLQLGQDAHNICSAWDAPLARSKLWDPHCESDQDHAFRSSHHKGFSLLSFHL